MSTSLDCDGVRMHLLASIDGETGPVSAEDRRHAATCPPCQQWLANFEKLRGGLQDLAYQETRADLWPTVRGRILRPGRLPVDQLWLLGALVLAWRALQLFVDLPMPALHPLVPLLAAIVVMWRVGGDLLTIETFTPELQKRGI